MAQGIVRYADPRTTPSPVQSFDDWLGREEPIDVWMNRALRNYRPRLQQAGLSAGHLQIYAPEQGRRQSLPRWVDARDVELGGVSLRLCRAQTKRSAIYSRPYFLGDFERTADGLRLKRAIQVEHGHARRFRFAFDHIFAAWRRVRLKQVGDTVRLTIANDLPPEEQRILALGWSASESTSPAVRHVAFPMRAMPFVAHAFSRLGMRLEGGSL